MTLLNECQNLNFLFQNSVESFRIFLIENNSVGTHFIGLLLTDVLMYFNFVPVGFFQLQSIDYLWFDRKNLVNRFLYKELIKGTTRVENITL